MISTVLSRIDSTKLYPPFFAALQALLADAHAGGADYFAISGFRSYSEQTVLFAQGRTAPGKIVTQAIAGESAHNFGIAVDLCRDGFIERAGLQPDYRPESYEPLRLLAPKHGLIWGGAWSNPDRPHVQLPGYVNANQLKPLRTIYEARGLLSVFQHLDAPTVIVP